MPTFGHWSFVVLKLGIKNLNVICWFTLPEHTSSPKTSKTPLLGTTISVNYALKESLTVRDSTPLGLATWWWFPSVKQRLELTIRSTRTWARRLSMQILTGHTDASHWNYSFFFEFQCLHRYWADQLELVNSFELFSPGSHAVIQAWTTWFHQMKWSIVTLLSDQLYPYQKQVANFQVLFQMF